MLRKVGERNVIQTRNHINYFSLHKITTKISRSYLKRNNLTSEGFLFRSSKKILFFTSIFATKADLQYEDKRW